MSYLLLKSTASRVLEKDNFHISLVPAGRPLIRLLGYWRYNIAASRVAFPPSSALHEEQQVSASVGSLAHVIGRRQEAG